MRAFSSTWLFMLTATLFLNPICAITEAGEGVSNQGSREADYAASDTPSATADQPTDQIMGPPAPLASSIAGMAQYAELRGFPGSSSGLIPGATLRYQTLHMNARRLIASLRIQAQFLALQIGRDARLRHRGPPEGSSR